MATEGIVFLYCSYVCNCIKNPNFANCRFSFRKLQIFISFRFAPFHFASAVIIYRIIVLTYHTIYPKDDGSCLLWVMSTEISVEIAVDIAVDTRSILGRQSVDIAVDSRSTLGRATVNSRSRCVSADIAFRSPTLRRHFADSWSILDRCIGQ